MREKFRSQQELDFTLSNLKVTNEYYARYERSSQVLNDNPQIVAAIHRDLAKVFGGGKRGEGGRDCAFSSDTVLRILIVKQIEGRFIEKVREIDPALVGQQRLRTRDVKRLYFETNRQVGKRSDVDKELKTAYAALIQHVEAVLIWADQVCETIRTAHTDYTWELDVQLLALVKEYEPYIARGVRVLDQASRRVLEGSRSPISRSSSASSSRTWN